jgi:hypothetical protein
MGIDIGTTETNTQPLIPSECSPVFCIDKTIITLPYKLKEL